MHPKKSIEERVRQAAEAALADHQYVSAIDVLTGIQFLAPVHLKHWRAGHVDSLERLLQANLNKLARAMQSFRQWARHASGTSAGCTRGTPSPNKCRRLSRAGEPENDS